MTRKNTDPGVDVEKDMGSARTISGATTSVTGFLGSLAQGPVGTPVLCLNFDDFQKRFGGLDAAHVTSFQVSQFFLNGGAQAWVSRLATASAAPTGPDVAGSQADGTGIHVFDQVEFINLLIVPDMAAMAPSDYLTAAMAVLNYATQRRAFAILDMPGTIRTPSDAAAWGASAPPSFGRAIISGATYFPQVKVPNPSAAEPLQIGASGTLAGIYAANDVATGVWKAPAGTTAALTGVQELAYVMSDAENGDLNPLGVNALRSFPVYGNVVWGARTLDAGRGGDPSWTYISVRRLLLYIEQSLLQSLQWVAFEPNGERLWAQIRLSVDGFLNTLYEEGAFAGAAAAQAYQCICDVSTTTAEDMANDVVNIQVEVAPLQPAEFVVIDLQLRTASA